MNTGIYKRHIEAQERRIIGGGAAGIRPPDDMAVDEWAERHLELSERVSPRPGRIRLEPYQREPIRAFRNNVRIVLVWASQTGKTIVIQCCLGWAIDQRPGPGMYVGPEEKTLQRRSRKHLMPFIEGAPVLRRHLTANRHDFQTYEYRLDNMTIFLASAASPSQMASEPIQYLFRDECDKYRDATEKEANSFALAERRTAAYDVQRRILDATTPTVEDADGWQSLIAGTWEEFYVPCPHCAVAEVSHDPKTGARNPGWQVLEFKQFRYPSRNKLGPDQWEPMAEYQERVRRNTYYECRDCGKPIREPLRYRMVRKGQWHARNPGAAHRSLHLPGWYARSGYNSFGSTAARYVEGLEDPEAMQSWTNNDAALPYKALAENGNEDLVLSHRGEYTRRQVPTEAPVILTMTADVHKICHHWAVWANTRYRSWLIDWGKAESLAELKDIRAENTYQNPAGEVHGIDVAFIDCEYRTDEIYDLALEDDRIIPISGRARSGLTKWSDITTYAGENRGSLSRPIRALLCRDEYFKDQLLLRFESGRCDDGTIDLAATDWLLPRDVSRELVRHLLGEIMVKSKDSRGFEVRTFKKVGPNHWLDCAKYNLAARFVLKPNLRDLDAPAPPPAAPEQASRVVVGPAESPV
ncbi:MAG: hypothetical protein GXP31_13160 [Kiritimatiellaeota bacterium]|nr:hypothetical protein [Kiritimatiellota bacterium]